MTKKTTLITLTLILLLAAASRIIHMNAQSLWVDEGFSYYITQQPDMMPLLRRDVHPPLYFVALREWTALAGTSELALRFFSFLPSMLSVAVVCQLARELARARGSTLNAGVPALAALLMALADSEIYLSQEARMYTLHVLFAVTSMWAFLRWLRIQKALSRGTFWLALWIVSTVALMYTHYLGVWTALVEGMYAVFFLRGHTRRVAVTALIFSGVVFSFWLLGVGINQLGNGEGYNRSEPSSWSTLMGLRNNWFTQQWPVMIGLAAMGTVTLVYNSRIRVRWRPVGPSVLLAAWIAIPVALTFLFNTWLPILAPVRLSQITPAVALLPAFGLGNLRQPARGMLVIAIVVYGVTTVDFARLKPDGRGMAALTAPYTGPSDLVLTNIDGGDYDMLYYYQKTLPPDTTVRSLKMWRDFEPETYTSEGPVLVAQYDTVWLLHWSSDGQVFPWLVNSGHVETMRIDVDLQGSQLEIYRYDVLPEDPAGVYENGMTLRNFAFDSETLRADLWWSADTALDADYTTSAFLLDDGGQLVAQSDSLPFNGDRPTTGWRPGEVIYDPKLLELKEGIDRLPPGRYQVGVQVYRWSPEGTTRSLTTDGQQWAVVGQFSTAAPVEP